MCIRDSSCVGRIRYLGVVFYDADRIPTALGAKDEDLVAALSLIHISEPTRPY